MADRELPLALLSKATESREATPLEEAVAAKLVDDMNLLRLKAAARFLARGLSPEIYWWDLLQEAVARVLNGSRRCPPDVPVDVFMIGVMRSIRAEHWRRRSIFDLSASFREADVFDPAPDPERVLLAQQELEAIGEPAMKGSTALMGVKGIVFPYRRGLLPDGLDPATLGEVTARIRRRLSESAARKDPTDRSAAAPGSTPRPH